MKTIEERAKESLALHFDESRNTFNREHRNMREWEYGYCQGATEQRAIDIERFLSLVDSLDVDKLYKEAQVLSDGSRIPSTEFISRLRKAMEE